MKPINRLIAVHFFETFDTVGLLLLLPHTQHLQQQLFICLKVDKFTPLNNRLFFSLKHTQV